MVFYEDPKNGFSVMPVICDSAVLNETTFISLHCRCCTGAFPDGCAV